MLGKEKKPHIIFRNIIKYCKLMNYDINDILKMSDNELRLWYKHVKDITENETNFRIMTGMTLDDRGNEHKLLAIIQTKFSRRSDE